MTVKELSQLYYLNREIERGKQSLKALEDKIGPAAPALSGMPHSPNRTASATERIAVEMVDLEAIIAAKQIQCIHERARLMRYIHGIEDSFTRSIFELRFVEGMSWQQVANRIGNNTADSVRKRCYRYLRAESEKQAAEHEKDEGAGE